MYTPTKTELEELRFRKIEDRFYFRVAWLMDIAIQNWDFFILKYKDENWDAIIIKFYPRSLDHLKSIILAFNPTE